jgi:hypothetical protein
MSHYKSIKKADVWNALQNGKTVAACVLENTPKHRAGVRDLRRLSVTTVEELLACDYVVYFVKDED